MACKPYGLVYSCSVHHLEGMVVFERSNNTDNLKTKQTMIIDDKTFGFEWVNDFHISLPLLTFPELAPDQESSTNILNALNDDCLREIFRQLDHFDQYEVALVCHRFRDVVMSIKTKYLEITDYNCTPFWKLEPVIRMFGASILTVEITANPCPEIVLGFLARYCENLGKFVGTINCDGTISDMALIFPRLQWLDLGTAKYPGVIVFQPNANIHRIRMGEVDYLPPIHFPELRHLTVSLAETDMARYIRFFALNRQIETLALDVEFGASVSIVLEQLPDLRHFEASQLDITDVDNIEAIGQLKHLETLGLHNVFGDFVPICRQLVENGIQLKYLSVKSYYRPPSGDVTIGHIIHMKSLRTIDMHAVDLAPRRIRDSLERLIHLEQFVLYVYYKQSHIIVDQSDEFDAIAEMLRTNRSIDLKLSICAYVDENSSQEVSFQISY